MATPSVPISLSTPIVSITTTVPTLKERVWVELTDILQKYSTVSLSEKDLSSSAMSKFRWVPCLCGVLDLGVTI